MSMYIHRKLFQDIPSTKTVNTSNNDGAASKAAPHAHELAAAALAAREHWPPDEHDGLSEHPPAAVMLLVLGNGARYILAITLSI